MKHSIEYLASFLTEDPDIYVRNARLIHEAGEVMDEAPRPRKPRAKKGDKPAEPEGWKEGSWAAKQAAAAKPEASATPAAPVAKKPRKPRVKKVPVVPPDVAAAATPDQPLTPPEVKKLVTDLGGTPDQAAEIQDSGKYLTPDEVEELLQSLEQRIDDTTKLARGETPPVNNLDDLKPAAPGETPDVNGMSDDEFDQYARANDPDQLTKPEPVDDSSLETPLDDPKDTPVDADIVPQGDDPQTTAKREMIKRVKGQFDFDMALKVLRASGVNATPVKLINQVNKYGVDNLVKFMAKKGVFRNVVNTAAQDQIKRAQMTRQFIKQMANNPELERWFVDQITQNRNFGIMAERSLDDRAKEEYVTTLLKTKPKANHGIPHRTGPLPRRV